jgi:hypothetical protein
VIAVSLQLPMWKVAPSNGAPQLVWRVGSDFTVSLRDNGACRLLRLLFCVLVMSRD